MKKIICLLLVLLTMIHGVKVSAEFGLIRANGDTLMDPNYYVGHGEFFELTVRYDEYMVPTDFEDYDHTCDITFSCDPYSEYLILPLEGFTIGFLNYNYGDSDYNIWHDYEVVDNNSFYKNNGTISFPNFDSSTYLQKICDFDLDAWNEFLNSNNDCINYKGDNYSIENAIVGQTQDVKRVIFSTFTHFTSGAFIACKLYRSSFDNETYKEKTPYIVTSVTKPITLEELLTYIKVEDNYDGDCKNNLVVVEEETSYRTSGDKMEKGTYQISLSVNDSSGNCSKQIIYVSVLDYEAPVINGPSTFTTQYNANKTALDLAASLLRASDDCDGNIADFYVISDEYTKYKNVVGDYTVVYGIKDSSGNEATKTVVIKVRDSVKPIIRNTKSLSQNVGTPLLSKNEILEFFEIFDEYDKDNITIELDGYEEYASNYDKIGKYSMELKVTDQSGNLTTKFFNFAVIDDEKPTIEIVDGIKTIIVDKGTVLTEEEIRNIIINQTNETSSIVSLSSLYFSEENPSGKYDVVVTFENGNVETYSLLVNENTIDPNYDIIIIICVGVVLLAFCGKIGYDLYKKKKKTV